MDDEIAKVQPISTSNFVKRDGAIPMTGNLNLGNNKITNLANPINALDAPSKRYVEAITNDFFFKHNYENNQISMNVNINMNNNSISGKKRNMYTEIKMRIWL